MFRNLDRNNDQTEEDFDDEVDVPLSIFLTPTKFQISNDWVAIKMFKKIGKTVSD